MTDPATKYAHAKAGRQKHLDAILNSSSKDRIVVAGPGTGKTYLFKEVLKGKKNTLTLTFVNALVEDLSLELCGLSEVRTLHSYARGELSRVLGENVKLFPKLPATIRADAKLLLDQDIDFDAIFHNRDDDNPAVAFYKKRKDYYDKHYGYSDVIFAIVKRFEQKPDQIPTYEQVVVDEFQDFNKLEVSLIELLSQKSPMLLAGDDDQALYAFKSASADHIRFKHGDGCPEYESFNLPFCSRCPRVVVDVTNDIVEGAIKYGLLQGRLSKPYIYFDDEAKDKVSDANPKVVYRQYFAKQIPWFIQQSIDDIAQEVRGQFSVLVISPTKKQCELLAKALREKGYQNVEYVERDGEREPTLLDGVRLLLINKKSNLGWRIAAKCFLPDAEFRKLLEASDQPMADPISKLIDKKAKKDIDELLTVCRAAKNGDTIDEAALVKVLDKLGHASVDISRDFLRGEIGDDLDRGASAATRKVPIKITTIQSSKGLAADYVFMTHFDDQYFIKDKDKTKISDQDVCNFLVAVTRAKKKLFWISSNTKMEPTFLGWIKTGHIERA